MSAATHQVKRIFPAIERELDQDLLAFTAACQANVQAEIGGAPLGKVASPAMSNALALWRAHVDEAIARLNRTARNARGRALALEAMQTLALALAQLSDGMIKTDPTAAAASGEQSLVTLATYQELAGRLARVLR
jgi:hypothetical protein